jgi:hypothetical protein
MTLEIRIDLENDAFAGENLRSKIRRILANAVARMPENPRKGHRIVLIDVNGNTCGEAIFIK